MKRLIAFLLRAIAFGKEVKTELSRTISYVMACRRINRLEAELVSKRRCLDLLRDEIARLTHEMHIEQLSEQLAAERSQLTAEYSPPGQRQTWRVA